MKKGIVLGVGINDADYSPISKCPYYVTWHSMLSRCYNPKSLAKNPTYVGCSVTNEWLTFSVFKAWMEKQDWHGKQLDKDLRIPGNKEYGPIACLFVSHQINGLLSTQPSLRGDLPIGVNRYGDSYKVTFKKQRKTIHLGVFTSIHEAAQAYRNAKAEWIEFHAANEACPLTKTALISAANNFRGIP